MANKWTRAGRRWSWSVTHLSYSVLVFSGKPERAYEVLAENEGEGDMCGLGKRVPLRALSPLERRWRSPRSLPRWARAGEGVGRGE